MSAAAVREALDWADRYKRTSEGAEHARVLIRLGERPKIRKRVLGFYRDRPDDRDVTFTGAEVSAIYEALADVRDEYARKARVAEAGVGIVAGQGVTS